MPDPSDSWAHPAGQCLRASAWTCRPTSRRASLPSHSCRSSISRFGRRHGQSQPHAPSCGKLGHWDLEPDDVRSRALTCRVSRTTSLHIVSPGHLLWKANSSEVVCAGIRDANLHGLHLHLVAEQTGHKLWNRCIGTVLKKLTCRHKAYSKAFKLLLLISPASARH